MGLLGKRTILGFTPMYQSHGSAMDPLISPVTPPTNIDQLHPSTVSSKRTEPSGRTQHLVTRPLEGLIFGSTKTV